MTYGVGANCTFRVDGDSTYKNKLKEKNIICFI